MTTQIRLPQTSFYTGVKNKLTNPKFDFWTRLPLLVDPDTAPGDDFFTLSTSGQTFTADRWVAELSTSGSAEIVIDQVTDDAANPDGFPNSLRAKMSSVETLTDSHFLTIGQTIEAADATAFELGVSSSDKTISLSFWVKSSVSGTFHVCLRNGYYGTSGSPSVSLARTYVAPFTVTTPSTWEHKDIQIPTDSSVATNWTWHTESGVGLEVLWVVYAGTDYQTALVNEWKNDNLIATATQASFDTTLNATFEITGCQIELGPNTTQFESRPISLESTILKNYYQRGVFVESAYGYFSGSTRQNSKFVSFDRIIPGRVPTFNVWVKHGNTNQVAPSGTDGWTQNISESQHSYPSPVVETVYENALLISYEKITSTGICTPTVYWEIESELYSNE